MFNMFNKSKKRKNVLQQEKRHLQRDLCELD